MPARKTLANPLALFSVEIGHRHEANIGIDGERIVGCPGATTPGPDDPDINRIVSSGGLSILSGSGRCGNPCGYRYGNRTTGANKTPAADVGLFGTGNVGSMTFAHGNLSWFNTRKEASGSGPIYKNSAFLLIPHCIEKGITLSS